MELVFEKTKMQCLKRILSQTKDLELTQEVKLSEGMPDVGNVLGAWGQVLIRGKEWRSNSIGINGGVMCWVMYVPEEEKQPRMVEEWIPFQTQMDIPDTIHDGQICVIPALRYIDARSISAGKLMLRACVSLQIRANVSEETEYFIPPQTETHIQLLKNSYRMQIPCEAGEKSFVMDEEFSIDGPIPEKLLQYRLQPAITEIKVMVGKVVFRGSALVQGMYMAENAVHSFQMDIPFAQYAQLEGEFDPEATAWIYPAVTSLELELSGGNNLHMKAGLTGQYVICDQKEIMLVEDAYSTTHQLQLHNQEIELSRVLEDKEQQIRGEFSPKESGRVVDVVFYPDMPRTQRNAEELEHQLSGRYQILYYDADNTVCAETGKWEQTLRKNADEKTKCQMWLCPVSFATADGIDLVCQSITMASEGMEAIMALTVSDEQMHLQDRPSLILRRKGDTSLWQIAKETGSTVDRIKTANGLEAEPTADKMLLIPT